jgi:signal transduction histidine kinase
VPALVLGIALPTLLLGGGWLAASLRERASLGRERIAALGRTADAIRGAVDESLEELRAREDARPFDVYNPLWSPPDVVALAAPIAPSPLAVDPADRRIVGYFQVQPDGAVLTPYSPRPNGTDTERAQRVVGLVLSPPYAPVRGLASWGEVRLAAQSAEPADARPVTTPSAEASESPDLAPQAPLNVTSNAWAQGVYQDIQMAQAGSAEANRRVLDPGRQAPVVRRRDVTWQDVQSEPQRRTNATASARGDAAAPRPGGGSASQPLPRPRPEVEVDYTPMSWKALGDEIVLHRIVSDRGTKVVQGVILDRRFLVRQWIPSLARRHALPGVVPAVVERDAPDMHCALLEPASRILAGVGLCYSAAAVAEASRGLEDDIGLQVSALLGLVVIVALAAFVVNRAARRAEALSAQKSAFVSAVSHELRTPLTTIRMHAEMLREGLVPEDKRGRFLSQLVHEAARLGHLVENVLELARLEQGRRSLELCSADLASHVAAVVDEQRDLARARGFELVGPEPGLEVVASFDEQAVSQIVANLIDNSLKYAARADRRDIEVRVEPKGPGAVVRVTDHGPGIAPAERERVFERFHRAVGEAQGHIPGTGIGLALVRELARAQGGDAIVAEPDGGGCEVRVGLGTMP